MVGMTGIMCVLGWGGDGDEIGGGGLFRGEVQPLSHNGSGF